MSSPLSKEFIMSGFMGSRPPKAPYGDMNVLLLDVSTHYHRKQSTQPFDPTAMVKSQRYAFEWLVDTINKFNGGTWLQFSDHSYNTLCNQQFLMVEALLSIMPVPFRSTVAAILQDPSFIAFATQQVPAS